MRHLNAHPSHRAIQARGTIDDTPDMLRGPKNTHGIESKRDPSSDELAVKAALIEVQIELELLRREVRRLEHENSRLRASLGVLHPDLAALLQEARSPSEGDT